MVSRAEVDVSAPVEAVPEMELAGYVALTRSGFALPCYVDRPGSNAWHVARCSVDGDHRGVVTGFDEYFDADGARIAPLPPERMRKVGQGDPWTDVFLRQGDPVVGTAEEVLRELEPVVEELRRSIPLSLLDLALAAGEEDVSDLVAIAERHVGRAHGVEKAADWRRDMLASNARLTVRRRLASMDADGVWRREVRRMVVEERPGGATARLPAALAAALSGDRLEDLRADLEHLGARLGVALDLETVAGDEPRQPAAPARDHAAPAARSAPDPASVGKGVPAPLRILVACSGERARAIARYVSPPDWTPLRGPSDADRHWTMGRGGERPDDELPGRSVIDVVHVDMPPGSDGDYDAVVWLVDDDLADTASFALAMLRDGARAGARRAAVRLLAPALPADQPSRLLMAPETLPPSAGWDALVDTSLARSPFWTGNPSRAVDRRIADLVVGSALLAAVDREIRKALLERREGGPTRLFSYAFGHGGLGGSDPELGLMSESSATGRSDADRHDAVFSFALSASRGGPRSAPTGYAAVRRPDADFAAFADAVVSSVLMLGPAGTKAGRPPLRRSEAFDDWSARGRATMEGGPIAKLRTPELAVRIGMDRGPSVVVLAEAPGLETVRSAAAAGLAVARYTDRDTLADVLMERVGERTPLPRELRLPRIGRLAANRGLAVRGIDPRDVLRTPSGSEWLDLARGSELEPLYRAYRPRIDALEVEELVVPRAAAEEAMRRGDRAAEALRVMAGRRADVARLKRPRDLAVAWTEPQDGAVRRYVIEDGVVPVRVAELPRHVVPGERMFMVDGDAAVPMLFGSRLFEVWARATTTRSTSWLSRFSVGRTFETFPIPPVFEAAGRDGRAELRLQSADGPLADLVRRFDLELDPGEPGLATARAGVMEVRDHRDLWDQVNGTLLDVIELSAEASDIDILDRLLSMNRAA